LYAIDAPVLLFFRDLQFAFAATAATPVGAPAAAASFDLELEALAATTARALTASARDPLRTSLGVGLIFPPFHRVNRWPAVRNGYNRSRVGSNDFFVEHLRAAPVIAVLRGARAENAVRIAEACWQAGVVLVEVSRSHDEAFEAVRAVCARASALGRIAGAGTVSTADDVGAAVAAGAAFAVAPGYSTAAADAASTAQLPYLPGGAAPSGVQAAIDNGFRTLKLFPARDLGAGWIRALSGPFPETAFVAVGGVTAVNAVDFVASGAVGVGIGSGLDADELPALLKRLRAARSN
jgi:2-dehydro-3-deoxyphosphogluconate aldolase/(4S)-4-hydroxy-2-oxoglutarate aldolase